MSDIKLFHLNGKKVENATVSEIDSGAMELERPLQTLFEKNLEPMLGVRFLASEYKTTNGRMDTLGLDENNCPVIIEYKRQASENIINQGLFYMDWLMEHQADFKLLVMESPHKAAAKNIAWSAPRLVCVASDFTRYDEHAIKQMNRNIELIRYRRFGDDLLMLELLTATTGTAVTKPTKFAKGQKTLAGQKEHNTIIAEAKGAHKVLFESLTDFICSLGDDIQEKPLKLYIAFKRLKNFACVRFQKGKIIVWVALNPDKEESIQGFTRDVRKIGHHGTGDWEITISSADDLARAKPLIEKAYNL